MSAIVRHSFRLVEDLTGLVDRRLDPSLDTSLPPLSPSPAPAVVKFDAAFLDRKMREHKHWQEFHEQVTAASIIQEVLEVAEGLDSDDLD